MVDNQIGIITTPNLKVSNNPKTLGVHIIYGTYGDPYDAQNIKLGACYAYCHSNIRIWIFIF